MEWVAIDVNIAGNTVTHRVAEKFKLRVAEAVGLLTLTFAGMAQHAEDGVLLDVTDSQIEEWARWHGKRGAFAEFFKAQFCDADSKVRGWDEYNGKHIKKSHDARERMQKLRTDRANYSPDVRTESANGSRNVRTEAANGSRTVRELTAHGSRTVRSNTTEQDSTREKTNTLPQPLPVADGAGQGAEQPVFPEPLKTPDVGTAYADAYRERFGVDMRRGRSRALLVALEADHGADEVLTRWRRFLAAHGTMDGTAARFAKSFSEWGAEGTAIASESPPRDEAATLWDRYVAADLLTQWPRADYQRIGGELVTAGLYPTVDAFMAEIAITQPWTLNVARMTDATAIKVIADRLRTARAREVVTT